MSIFSIFAYLTIWHLGFVLVFCSKGEVHPKGHMLLLLLQWISASHHRWSRDVSGAHCSKTGRMWHPENKKKALSPGTHKAFVIL